jgi:hypothetical protein
MAFFPKRKRKAGPSKNEEKVRRARDAEAQTQAAGTLSSRFPALRGLKLRLTFKGAQGQLLQEDDIALKPNDAFEIGADCPGRCGSGHFDFVAAVSDALGRAQDSGAAELSCAETLYGGSPNPCGCLARCEFTTER